MNRGILLLNDFIPLVRLASLKSMFPSNKIPASTYIMVLISEEVKVSDINEV